MQKFEIAKAPTNWRIGAKIKSQADHFLVLKFAITRVGRFIDSPPDTSPLKLALRRWRARFIPHMEQDDVLTILSALQSEGLQCWLAGGWGVDALLQVETRYHSDIDMVIEDFARDEPRACEALSKLGYTHRLSRRGGIWMPQVTKLTDGAGRQIELMSIDWERLTQGFGSNLEHGDEMALAKVQRDVLGEGKIAGVGVPCLSRRAQLLFHTHFPAKGKYLRDVTALSESGK